MSRISINLLTRNCIVRIIRLLGIIDEGIRLIVLFIPLLITFLLLLIIILLKLTISLRGQQVELESIYLRIDEDLQISQQLLDLR